VIRASAMIGLGLRTIENFKDHIDELYAGRE